MISLQTNYANLVAQNTLQGTNKDFTSSLEKLSTGFRINSAADDAAGLQIANRLEAQNRGMGVASRNAQDAISMMQTAEGALDEATNIALRMNDLATQSANGSASAEDRTAMNDEYQALASEFNSIMDNTSFGGKKLLNGGDFGGGAVTFQIGATSAETLDVDASAKIGNITGSGALTGDISTAAGATAAMDSLSGAGGTSLVDNIGAARSEFGANINRLEHTITNLGNMQENTAAAKSRIMDTDFASESASMSKNQMLMQSGAAMLGQSKMSSQLAMQMLG